MVGIEAGAWGLFGGFALEGLEFHAALRRHGCWPWRVQSSDSQTASAPEAGPLVYLVGELIRLLIGGGLAWAAAATGQIAGPLGALGVGAAAPTIIGQLAKFVPLKASEGSGTPAAPASIQPVTAREAAD